jgi:hypothetical protein
MSSCACLQLTEATLAFPTEDIDRKEEITLWGPETLHAMPGAAAFMQGEDAWENIYELSVEAGMHWDQGPYRSSLQEALTEMDDPTESIQDPEIEAALDQWRRGVEDMDDLHEPSLFTEWNQAAGCSSFVGAAELGGKNMKIPQYTPEMLAQRDTLNWMFNFHWNTTFYPGDTMTSVVPDTTELLELVAVGENYGVAKCEYGAVFVPKGAINYLQHNGGANVGTIFDGEITFTPGKKFLWRLTRDGVKFTYEDMCGNRRADDY